MTEGGKTIGSVVIDSNTGLNRERLWERNHAKKVLKKSKIAVVIDANLKEIKNGVKGMCINVSSMHDLQDEEFAGLHQKRHRVADEELHTSIRRLRNKALHRQCAKLRKDVAQQFALFYFLDNRLDLIGITKLSA